jgi:apolipoprotein D and lipocalin family protein
MGTWYEIAKFPNSFQKKCIRNTTAQYSQQPDGTIRVVNTCLQAEGKVKEIAGEVRQVGASNSAQLEVRFAPAWLSWFPMVWGDYWVIDLDPQYQLAAVSEPEREMLWILSRTPQVSQTSYDALLARLRAKGFELDKLEPTLHTK